MQSNIPSVVSDLEIRDEFASLQVTAKFTKVAKILATNNAKVILVVEGRKKKEVIGVITEQHFLQICAKGVDPKLTEVRDNMQTNILRLKDNTPVDVVIRLVDENKPDAVIVMDANRRFRGYVSPKDFLNLKNQQYLSDYVNNRTASEKSFISQVGRRPTVSRSLRRVETHSTPIELGSDKLFSHNEVKQIVQLTQHFCSDGGRSNQIASRVGIAHNHLLCVGQNGPFGTCGIWAVSDTQIDELTSGGIERDLFYITVVEDNEQIPTSWLNGVELLSEKFNTQMKINCLSMDNQNSLSIPFVKDIKSATKKRTKSISHSQIKKTTMELISKQKESSNLGIGNFIICATIRTS